jgi:hypothetical protein
MPVCDEWLLPRSGVGVIAPSLVIAPPGNPIIRLDLRMLDSVEVSDDDSSDIVITCGGLDVALHIADGREAVQRLVCAAAPLTRKHARPAPWSPSPQ